jgi:dipeptidyl aminopeptidase/acylaminoacyl peptidase
LDFLSSSTIETAGPAWAKRTVGSNSVFDDPENYLKLSVLYKAASIHTPTLLAVGDFDSLETVLGTIGMYNGLRYLGRDVTMLRYRDQGHVFHQAAMKDFWDRELRFFDQHLRGGGTPP